MTHLGEQKRKYRVIGVSKETVSRKTFTRDTADGTKVSITVAEYFKDQYGITLRLEVLCILPYVDRGKICIFIHLYSHAISHEGSPHVTLKVTLK